MVFSFVCARRRYSRQSFVVVETIMSPRLRRYNKVLTRVRRPTDQVLEEPEGGDEMVRLPKRIRGLGNGLEHGLVKAEEANTKDSRP
jgi:hypothetical protein